MKQSAERLRDAYEILAGIPAERFIPDLDQYANNTKITRGTLACGIGWLAMHPGFKRLGLIPSFFADDTSLTLDGAVASLNEAVVAVFGTKYPDDLFGVRGKSEYDHEPSTATLTDKALLLYRLRRYLGQPEGTALLLARRDA